jgi:hypothetical protein
MNTDEITWSCECGNVNAGETCAKCGKPRPAELTEEERDALAMVNAFNSRMGHRTTENTWKGWPQQGRDGYVAMLRHVRAPLIEKHAREVAELRERATATVADLKKSLLEESRLLEAQTAKPKTPAPAVSTEDMLRGMQDGKPAPAGEGPKLRRLKAALRGFSEHVQKYGTVGIPSEGFITAAREDFAEEMAAKDNRIAELEAKLDEAGKLAADEDGKSSMRLALYWLGRQAECGADFAIKTASDVLRNYIVEGKPAAPAASPGEITTEHTRALAANWTAWDVLEEKVNADIRANLARAEERHQAEMSAKHQDYVRVAQALDRHVANRQRLTLYMEQKFGEACQSPDSPEEAAIRKIEEYASWPLTGHRGSCTSDQQTAAPEGDVRIPEETMSRVE